jgi:hypothetical protein
MSKHNMFGQDFDPYDALVNLSARLDRLEQVHNALASDYVKSQKDLDLVLNSLNSLQKGHIALSDFVSTVVLSKVGGK